MLELVSNAIKKKLTELNTGIVSAKYYKPTSTRFNNGYIELVFEHDAKHHHRPLIFDDDSQCCVRIYLIRNTMLFDICGRAHISVSDLHNATVLKSPADIDAIEHPYEGQLVLFKLVRFAMIYHNNEWIQNTEYDKLSIPVQYFYESIRRDFVQIAPGENFLKFAVEYVFNRRVSCQS